MNQEIFDLIFERIKELKYQCYPFLPKEGTSYPFVVVGETQLLPRITKSFSIGEVSVFVHVWTDKESRKKCQQMMSEITEACNQFTSPHRWILLEGNSRIIADNSTNDTLWHGVLDLRYKFY